MQMPPYGYPARSVCGGLPGPQQTIGAAERYCVLQAQRYYPRATQLVTDLAGLVDEGIRWPEKDSQSQARH
eukprot:7740853-Pyramimonas_sp.AAC.1